jgi:hypothetical protein
MVEALSEVCNPGKCTLQSEPLQNPQSNPADNALDTLNCM